MLDVSSHGHAEPKAKSIDVGANLLGAWLRNKMRLRDQSHRLLIAVGAVAAASIIVLPALSSLQDHSFSAKLQAEKDLKDLDSMLAVQTERQRMLQPKVARAEMLSTTAGQTEAFMGHLLFVLNSVSSQMALSTLRCEIYGGDMTVHCDADAESTVAAQSFSEQARKAPGEKNTILVSTRPNEAMGKTGITFEWLQKVEVAQ